jgi:SAM-dependent methyltransferase
MGFAALKARQRAAWGLAPWERFAETLAPMHDRLVEALAPRAGECWLDVATGTGAVALRAARAGATVTALDLSPKLLQTARRLADEEGLVISFDEGDCENLPYETASFDVVTSAVGAIFAPDHQEVARELARVCRPVGRLGLTAWRPNPEYEAVLEPFRAPTEPGAGNPIDWGRKEYVLDLLGNTFQLRFVEGRHALRGESGEAIWQLFVTSHGPYKALHDSLEPSRREELHRAFVAYLERHQTECGINAPDEYLLVLGTRR